MAQHLVLVGLPGSGKSAVGHLVAGGLGCRLVDVDSLLVRERGMPVAQIFGMVGEPKFRQMERDAVRTARAGEPCVIAPGGGWAAQPGEINAAKQDSILFYLKCLPSVAAKRVEQGEIRPLLAGTDMGARIGELLKEREPYYVLAHYHVAADNRSADKVAAEVMDLARRHGGW